MVGTKGTKQGHSGQKETIGTFEVSLFFFSEGSLARGITGGASARQSRFLAMKARFSAGLLTFNDMIINMAKIFKRLNKALRRLSSSSCE